MTLCELCLQTGYPCWFAATAKMWPQYYMSRAYGEVFYCSWTPCLWNCRTSSWTGCWQATTPGNTVLHIWRGHATWIENFKWFHWIKSVNGLITFAGTILESGSCQVCVYKILLTHADIHTVAFLYVITCYFSCPFLFFYVTYFGPKLLLTGLWYTSNGGGRAYCL